MEELLEIAVVAAIKAGKKICEIYNTGNFEIEQKADNSPLTIADKEAHAIITEFLKTTQFPILSEEGKNIPYQERKKWETFWLVDPLDGTKEFIKRNGEFTVNIALIKNRYPVAGVIYVPAKKLLYFASQEIGSFMVDDVRSPEPFSRLKLAGTSLPHTFPGGGYIVVASRSHINEETQRYIEQRVSQCPNYEIISIGSSLKFCLVAEGKAHEYPRFGPTMEWDTAAGHAIVKFSGGTVIRADNGQELD
jgi:3'(2'), 5'-bisphosphate nucleotidase